MKKVLFLVSILSFGCLLMIADHPGVQLYARVIGGKGFVKGLKCADFEITINGKKRQASALYRMEGSKIAQKEPWYPLYRRFASPRGAVLIKHSENAYIIIYKKGVKSDVGTQPSLPGQGT